MTIKNGMILLPCCLLVLICSCRSFGPNFYPNPDALKLGQLKISESEQLFGEPTEKQNKTTVDGKYEIVNYHFTQNRLGTVSSRLLVLEFKDGILNSYEFVSSFDEDKTKVDLQGIDHLRSEIGKLSRNDVIAVLGEPDGKAVCPSIVEDYKDKCQKGVEIWGWFAADKVKFGFSNHVDVKDTNIYVAFDANGKIADVQTEENNRRIYHN
jgi:hypothetical protein